MRNYWIFLLMIFCSVSAFGQGTVVPKRILKVDIIDFREGAEVTPIRSIGGTAADIAAGRVDQLVTAAAVKAALDDLPAGGGGGGGISEETAREVAGDSTAVERAAREAADVAIRNDFPPEDRLTSPVASFRVSNDSVVAAVNNQRLLRWQILTGGMEQWLSNANQNYVDPSNTGQSWVSGGTGGTSTRPFGTPSWNGRSANQLIGDQTLRTIFGGYDNTIGPVLASSILVSHHSAIEVGVGGGGHNNITGGSNHFVDGGGYVGIYAGTSNLFRGGGFAFIGGSRADSISGEFVADIASDASRMEGGEFNAIMTSNGSRIYAGGLYNTVFSTFQAKVKGQYNIVSGLRAEAYGNGNYNGGARNVVGLFGSIESYSFTHGAFNNLTSSYTGVLGEANTVSGDHSFVAGDENILTGAYSFAVGQINQALNSYSAVWGRNNIVNSSYSWASGRNNTIAPSSSYSSILAGVNLTNDKPSTALTQNLELKGFLYDRRGDAGLNGEILTKDAAGTDWKPAGSLPVNNPTGGGNTLQQAIDDLDNKPSGSPSEISEFTAATSTSTITASNRAEYTITPGAPTTVTFDPSSLNTGGWFTVYVEGADVNAVTLARPSGNYKFEGNGSSSTVVLSGDYHSLFIRYDGTTLKIDER